jgi:CheY-like chemotaxis protein
MTKRDYLTTGEAAKLLNISRSTVSRRFDGGVIRGKLNPITGERLVSVKSLLAFMKEHGLPTNGLGIAKKEIVLGSSDPELQEAVERITSSDERLSLNSAKYGADTLILCSKTSPDLLIISDILPDISCADVINGLRRNDEQKVITVLCCARKTRQEDCMAWGADACLPVETLDPKLLSDEIYQLLELSKSQPVDETVVQHKRRWPRFTVKVPGKLGIYRLSAPRQHTWGKAVVQNISQGGAFLSDIHLDDGAIPADPFRIVLDINQPPLGDWRAHCQVVRLQSNGSLTAGVRFARISTSNRDKISAIAAD